MGKYVGGLIPLGVLLTAVTFIVSVVVYFRHEREPDELHQRFLARFYVYVMLFFSVLLVFIGSVFLLRGVLSYPFGLSFSYTGSVMLKERAPGETPASVEVRCDSRERLIDIAGGLMLGVVGVVFYAVHRSLEKRVEPPQLSPHSFLKQSYLMSSTVLYGGMAIYGISVSIYSILERYLIHTGISGENHLARPVPGTTLSVAIVALPIWILFIRELQTVWRSSGG